MKQFISIEIKKQDDNLVRIIGLFYKRGIFIESFSYAPEINTNNIRIVATVKCEKQIAQQACKHILNLVDVIDVKLLNNF